MKNNNLKPYTVNRQSFIIKYTLKGLGGSETSAEGGRKKMSQGGRIQEAGEPAYSLNIKALIYFRVCIRPPRQLTRPGIGRPMNSITAGR